MLPVRRMVRAGPAMGQTVHRWGSRPCVRRVRAEPTRAWRSG